MTRLTTLDFNKLTPYAVGFDKVIDDMFRYSNLAPSNGYPPYNIIKNDNEFQIEIALAGVKQEDLDINVAEGVLNVSHNPPEIDEEKQNFPGSYVHRGIAQRKFSRNFTLSDDVVVQDAKFENGMLYISLERIIPEEKKPRKITITSK
jgi:molecular chaperone IbpA|tara:strand:- start:495 stop:938 length:444 start_codon:yes stop_codon:yes gene_type:complete